MPPTPQVEFLTKELHNLGKGFIEMSNKITEIDIRSKYQEERINEILTTNKEVIKSIQTLNNLITGDKVDLNKIIADNKLENNKAYGRLVVKVTAISTALGMLLSFFGRKLFLVGM